MTRVALILFLLAGSATAKDYNIEVGTGYSATRNLGFVDELAPVVTTRIQWVPGKLSVDGSLVVRYADKLNGGDSTQTTVLLRGCYTPRRDHGLRACLGDWSSSLVTDNWEPKLGEGLMASIGWVAKMSDDFQFELDLAHVPDTHVAPRVSGTTLTLGVLGSRWGMRAWGTLVEPIDGSLPEDGVETAVVIVRRW